MNTPELLGIEKQTILSPDEDWTEGVYIVEVAWKNTNLIHRAVLWLGMVQSPLSDSVMEQFHDETIVKLWKNDPDAAKLTSVHNWIHGQYEDPINLSHRLPYYLKPVLEITNIDMMDKKDLQINTTEIHEQKKNH